MDILIIFCHILILGGLLLLLLNTLVTALVIPVVRKPKDEFGEDAPTVSVLVPARNEERCIGACVESLIAQDYPNLEVIVLDDRSEDGTGKILDELNQGPERQRLRTIEGVELPQGWVGKNWACHQLYQQASGDILLFTDADTVHEPWCVSAAVELSHSSGAGLVSVWPYQITKSLGEKLILPIIYLIGTGFMPHIVSWAAIRAEWIRKLVPGHILANFGGANGQFLCFTREGYDLVGGHEALRDDIVEDVRFGREMMARSSGGGAVVNADGASALKCRMYENFGEVWQGFSKNIWPAFAGNRVLFYLTGFVFFALLVLPFFALPFSCGVTFKLVLAEIVLILTIRLVISLRFKTSIVGAILHLPAMLIALAIGANSSRLGKKGKLTWKGREYNSTGGES